MGNSALVSRFGALRGFAALVIGMMAILLAGVSRAAPPTATDGLQNTALAALTAEVAALKKVCGPATPGPQVPACLGQVATVTVRTRGAGGGNAKALAALTEEVREMRADLVAAFAAFQQAIKRGTSDCAQAGQALESIKAAGINDTAINTIAVKIAELCLEETLNADTAVEAITKRGNYRLITKDMVLEPVAGAPFAPQIDADKEVRLKELDLRKELILLEQAQKKADEDDSNVVPIVLWATLPVTGFVAGFFIAGAQNPMGVDSNGDYNYGAATKGGGIGLATGLAAAGLGHLIWWAVTKD